jgi:peroxin-5
MAAGEQAIEAYYKSLSLNPTFVRARYNLGVSCINIGVYREAVEHLLGALDMQQGGGVNVSVNLWDTLRRTFILMERADLADLVGAGQEDGGAGLDVFRKEFDF